MTTHAPGPWVHTESGAARTDIIMAGAAIIATVVGDSAETEANARLIAAAPDMLEALRHAAQNMPHPDQMIDDAIAKATGGAA